MIRVKAKKLTSFFDKSRGLMFSEKISPTFLETRWGIHTFFVKNSIDVIILDDEMIVVKVKKCLKPWRLFIWNPRYKNVLELPAGYLEKIKVGDQVKLS